MKWEFDNLNIATNRQILGKQHLQIYFPSFLHHQLVIREAKVRSIQIKINADDEKIHVLGKYCTVNTSFSVSFLILTQVQNILETN